MWKSHIIRTDNFVTSCFCFLKGRQIKEYGWCNFQQMHFNCHRESGWGTLSSFTLHQSRQKKVATAAIAPAFNFISATCRDKMFKNSAQR